MSPDSDNENLDSSTSETVETAVMTSEPAGARRHASRSRATTVVLVALATTLTGSVSLNVAQFVNNRESGTPAGAGSPGTQVAAGALFGQAIESCDGGDYATIGDGGETLSIDTIGNDELSQGNPALSLAALSCMLSHLGMTDYLVAQVDSTRALDGMREGEWDRYRAVWNYHPDDGLTITITVSR